MRPYLKFQNTLLIILLVILFGCKEDEIVFEPPIITFDAGVSITSQRDSEIIIAFKVTAPAGLKSVTFDGISLSVNSEATQQSFQVNYSIDINELLGDKKLNQ